MTQTSEFIKTFLIVTSDPQVEALHLLPCFVSPDLFLVLNWGPFFALKANDRPALSLKGPKMIDCHSLTYSRSLQE